MHKYAAWRAGPFEAVEDQVEPEPELVAVVIAGPQDVLGRQFGEVGVLLGREVVEEGDGHRGGFLRGKVRDVDCVLGKLAERLSTRSVRLARMILIQASRNAMVNALVVRNVADLAAVPTGKPGRPSKSLNLDQALVFCTSLGGPMYAADVRMEFKTNGGQS